MAKKIEGWANDELMHYGVLGMKWGQHRARKNYAKADKMRQKIDKENAARKEYYRKGLDKKFGAEVTNAAKVGSKEVITKYNAKAAKYEAKAKRIENKHKARAGTKAYNRVKSQSTGKLVAKSLLMGTYGTLKYEQAKARNTSTGLAAVEGILYQIGDSVFTGGVLDKVEPRISARNRR